MTFFLHPGLRQAASTQPYLTFRESTRTALSDCPETVYWEICALRSPAPRVMTPSERQAPTWVPSQNLPPIELRRRGRLRTARSVHLGQWSVVVRQQLCARILRAECGRPSRPLSSRIGLVAPEKESVATTHCCGAASRTSSPTLTAPKVIWHAGHVRHTHAAFEQARIRPPNHSLQTRRGVRYCRGSCRRPARLSDCCAGGAGVAAGLASWCLKKVAGRPGRDVWTGQRPSAARARPARHPAPALAQWTP